MRFIPSLSAVQDIDDNRRERALFFAAVACDLLLLAIQLILCLRFSGEQISDARSYLSLAAYCAQNGTWYPSVNDTFATYLFGNGYVNLLALLMRVKDSIVWVYALNIAFTQIIVLTSAGIAYRLTGRRTSAYLTVCLLSLMGGFWGEAPIARTELCFIALAGLNLFAMMRRSGAALFFAGAMLALANWVRPLLVVYLPASMLYLLLTRTRMRRILAYLAGAALVIALIGTSTQRRFGDFVYQAQTMGINMLMGANDDADGGYVAEVYEEGKPGYIPEGSGVNYAQKDALFKQRAIEWMKAHPARFLSLIPSKLFYVLATDTYGGSAFFNNERETDNLAYLLELKDILLFRGERGLEAGDLVVLLSQAMYMLVFLLYLCSIVSSLLRGIALDSLHLHLIFALACGVTILTVGGARYHMPYIPIFCIFAAQQLDRMTQKRLRA